MKRNQELLDELYPAGGGPALDDVLARVRAERASRRRRRSAVGAMAIVAATALAVFWPRPQEEVAVVSTPKAQTVERISDEQLLAMVGGPAALVTLPDGRQAVMMLVPGRR
jgi:ferric-dicitrate binding protein FerR (iron transport regulator)